MKRQILFLVFIFVAVSSFSQSAKPKNENNRSSHLDVGVFGFADREAYRGTSTKYRAFPLMTYKNKNLKIAFPFSEYKIKLSEKISLIPNIKYRFQSLDEKDSSYFEGMQNAKETVEGGLRLEYHISDFVFALGYSSDLLSHHKGNIVDFEISKRINYKNKWFFTPIIGASILDDNFVEYYYGVSQQEVRADRGFYRGKNTMNTFGGIYIFHPINNKINLISLVTITRLGRGITKSPLTDEKYTFQSFLGFSYSLF